MSQAFHEESWPYPTVRPRGGATAEELSGPLLLQLGLRNAPIRGDICPPQDNNQVLHAKLEVNILQHECRPARVERVQE